MANETSEITLKEVYERLVTLEAKFDEALKRNDRVGKRFGIYVLLLVVLVLVDVGLSIISYFK